MKKSIQSNQQSLRRKKTSGRRSRSFLENHPVKPRDLVRFGWYYRRKAIYDEESKILGIVLEQPEWREGIYEKLSLQNGKWCIIERMEQTLMTCVYTLDAEFEYYPLYNLIKLEE